MSIQQVAAVALHTRGVTGKPLRPMVQVMDGDQMKLAALVGHETPEQLEAGIRALGEVYPEAHAFFLMLETAGVIEVWELDRVELLSWPTGGFTELELVSVGVPDG